MSLHIRNILQALPSFANSCMLGKNIQKIALLDRYHTCRNKLNSAADWNDAKICGSLTNQISIKNAMNEIIYSVMTITYLHKVCVKTHEMYLVNVSNIFFCCFARIIIWIFDINLKPKWNFKPTIYLNTK